MSELLVVKTTFTKGSKTSLDNAFSELWSHLDADFTGDNGIDYLSSGAKEYCIKTFGEDMLENYSDLLWFTDTTNYINDEQYTKEFIKFYKKYCNQFQFELTGIYTDNATSWLVLSAII